MNIVQIFRKNLNKFYSYRKWDNILERASLDIFEYIFQKAMKYMSSENNSDTGQSKKKADWNDYNYPCLIRIFHYDGDETPEALVWRARLLRINHMLILFTCLWNFVNNIVNAAQGVEDGVIRIFISLFVSLIFLPISLYIFYIPYRIYMKEDQTTCIFYVLSLVTFVFFALWSIADFADANGWVMFGRNVTANRGGASFFSFFSSVFCTLIAILTAINLVRFWKRDDSSSD